MPKRLLGLLYNTRRKQHNSLATSGCQTIKVILYHCSKIQAMKKIWQNYQDEQEEALGRGKWQRKTVYFKEGHVRDAAGTLKEDIALDEYPKMNKNLSNNILKLEVLLKQRLGNSIVLSDHISKEMNELNLNLIRFGCRSAFKVLIGLTFQT